MMNQDDGDGGDVSEEHEWFNNLNPQTYKPLSPLKLYCKAGFQIYVNVEKNSDL